MPWGSASSARPEAYAVSTLDASVEADIRRALDAGDLDEAATAAIRGYGPQIAGYLRVVMKSEQESSEAFSIFGEMLWKGLASFRGESSFLTWAYHLAWASVRRYGDDSFRRRAERLSTTAASRLAQEVFTTTGRQQQDQLAELRAQLAPEEQTLLVLRLDRDLSWREIAQVFDEEGVGEAALRKRFERLKARIRELAAAQGLLTSKER
jgi:RNA polymerase sigma-70 factor, ECF subfamily